MPGVPIRTPLRPAPAVRIGVGNLVWRQKGGTARPWGSRDHPGFPTTRLETQQSQPCLATLMVLALNQPVQIYLLYMYTYLAQRICKLDLQDSRMYVST